MTFYLHDEPQGTAGFAKDISVLSYEYVPF
jgi:hypothetical protein